LDVTPLPRASRPREFRFELLADVQSEKPRAATLSLTLGLHALLVASILIVPLFSEEPMEPSAALRAFFVAPSVVTPPPPPPPPPAALPASVQRAAAVRTPPPADDVFRAPIEIPDALPEPEPAFDLGVDGGVAGGVEGGVPGGVPGGVVGGLTSAPAPSRIVRIGGNIKAPTVVHRVDPVYPAIARQARITGAVLLRAVVDERGFVKEVQVVRGVPMLSDSAIAAVRQWRYQPLLLNGIPCEFELTVTVNFGLGS
jgi:protein TonB